MVSDFVFVCLVCLCSKAKALLGQSAKNHGNHNIIDDIYSVLLHYEVLKSIFLVYG